MEPTSEPDFLKLLLPVLVVILLIATGVVILNQHFRQNLFKQLLEKEALKSENQINLLKANLEAQEAERKRIALDIHDEIGALLSTSKIFVSQLSLSQSLEDHQLLKKKVIDIYDQIAFNIRSISHDLRPVVLEKFGLISAIDSLDENLEAAGIKFIFNTQNQFDFLPDAEVQLYRIVQELISNTIKHARANHIWLNILAKDSNIVFSYLDDGIGLQENIQKHGLGMKGIESRVSLFKGYFDIQKPGTRVHFQIVFPKFNIHV